MGMPAAAWPFFRYNVNDLERQLEVEAGVPVAADRRADIECVGRDRKPPDRPGRRVPSLGPWTACMQPRAAPKAC